MHSRGNGSEGRGRQLSARGVHRREDPGGGDGTAAAGVRENLHHIQSKSRGDFGHHRRAHFRRHCRGCGGVQQPTAAGRRDRAGRDCRLGTKLRLNLFV